MDRFSKTTEIDTSEVAAATMEEDTPQKSKVNNIIALVVCLLIAVVIWLFVMEKDTELMEKKFEGVPVYSDYTEVVSTTNADITVNGIRKNIVDLKSEDFKIVEVNGQYEIFLIGGKADIFALTNESTANEIKVSVTEK